MKSNQAVYKILSMGLYVVVCYYYYKLCLMVPSADNRCKQFKHSVGPDLCPNCLQRLSADNRSRH